LELSIELYCQKPIFIKSDNYIRVNLRIRGLVYPETTGEDRYQFGGFLLSGKRLGGLGRKCSYDHSSFYAGLGTVEAKPGKFLYVSEDDLAGLALILETNIISNPGELKDFMGMKITIDKGKSFSAPFARPDINISWNSQNRYVIPLDGFLTKKIVTT